MAKQHGKKQTSSTGSTDGATRKRDAAKPSTAAKSKHAPVKSASPSTADVLALIQDDLANLQKLGETVIMGEADGKLVIIIGVDGVLVGVNGGHITLDGIPVLAVKR